MDKWKPQVIIHKVNPENFLAFLQFVNNLNVCIGNSDVQFVAMV